MTKKYELNQSMLNAHLHVSINGPDSDTRAANEIIAKHQTKMPCCQTKEDGCCTSMRPCCTDHHDGQ